jgi:hypothetical protein
LGTKGTSDPLHEQILFGEESAIRGEA